MIAPYGLAFSSGAGFTLGASAFRIYLGINHSYGGATALEFGVSSPGISKSPSPSASGGEG